jgi:predicted acetyltransferase
MQLYCYDFSQFLHLDVNSDGEYEYQWLDSYWENETRFPFIIEAEGNIAGFALVRSEKDAEAEFHSMAEFFILKKSRFKGLGKKIAQEVFARFRGKWRVAVLDANLPAMLFWEKTISNYTSGRFVTRNQKGWDGPVYEFER